MKNNMNQNIDMNLILKEKLENLKLHYVRVHIQKDYKNRIQLLDIIRALIEEIEEILDDKKEDYIYYYLILVVEADQIINIVEYLLNLDEVFDIIECLTYIIDTPKFCTIHDEIGLEQNKSLDDFINCVENVEKMVDEYHLRKEKKI